MTNGEVIDQFVRTFLAAPDLTIRGVQERLAGTDYEIKILRSDVSAKLFQQEHPDPYMFPMATAGKEMASS